MNSATKSISSSHPVTLQVKRARSANFAWPLFLVCRLWARLRDTSLVLAYNRLLAGSRAAVNPASKRLLRPTWGDPKRCGPVLIYRLT